MSLERDPVPGRLRRQTDELLRDVRYALRGLARDRGFTTVAVLTLTLGIGASTAVFTVVDSVLLRPLHFADPHRLTMIRPTSGSRLSPAYLHEWRLHNQTFDDIAGWADARMNLTGREDPLEVFVDRTTTNFFEVLGMPSAVGRTFTRHADLSRVEPEVVLSYGLWHRLYGGDQVVIGQSVTLDEDSYTIIGVMPEGFTIRTTELAESRAELWIPQSLVPGDRTGMGGFLNVVGRLDVNATADRARADLSVIARRIEAQYPSYSHDWGVEVVPLLDATVQHVRSTILVLFGAVGVLWLLACINVAHLLLGRGAARLAELAVRFSLGARTGRILRQLLTESAVLASLGGVLGIVLAMWATQLFVAARPDGLELPRASEIAMNGRVLAFSLLVTMSSALLFGVLPAAGAARAAWHVAMRRTSGASAGRPPTHRASALIAAEVALALILLAGAGLLIRSFRALTDVDPGFQADQVLTLRTTLPASRYDTEDRIRVFGASLLERVAHVPGVSYAGVANYLPMSRFGVAERFEIREQPDATVEDQKFAWVSVVGGRYFEAMGIRLLRGRLPGTADTQGSEPVFLIDEELARTHWRDSDPIGAHLVWRSGDETLAGRIIGVVGRVRWESMAAAPSASAYWWFPHAPTRELTIVARTHAEPTAVAGLIATQVRELDPNQPVSDIRPMRDLVSADLARSRFTMLLLGSLAVAALILAGIGLYGVAAFAVTQRTREIGVRLAVGADPHAVVRPIVRRGLLLIGTGLAVGAAGALALGRAIAGLLYGVAPGDPITLGAAAMFLAVVGTVATYVPARRAALVDPAIALRAE